MEKSGFNFRFSKGGFEYMGELSKATDRFASFEIHNDLSDLDFGFYSYCSSSYRYNGSKSDNDPHYDPDIKDTKYNFNNNINSCINSYFRSRLGIESNFLGDSNNSRDGESNNSRDGESNNSSDGDSNNSSDGESNNSGYGIYGDIGKLWVICDNCYTSLYRKDHKMYICQHCGHYLKIRSKDRIELLIDPGTWDPMDEYMLTLDPIDWDSENTLNLEDSLKDHLKYLKKESEKWSRVAKRKLLDRDREMRRKLRESQEETSKVDSQEETSKVDSEEETSKVDSQEETYKVDSEEETYKVDSEDSDSEDSDSDDSDSDDSDDFDLEEETYQVDWKRWLELIEHFAREVRRKLLKWPDKNPAFDWEGLENFKITDLTSIDILKFVKKDIEHVAREMRSQLLKCPDKNTALDAFDWESLENLENLKITDRTSTELTYIDITITEEDSDRLERLERWLDLIDSNRFYEQLNFLRWQKLIDHFAREMRSQLIEHLARETRSQLIEWQEGNPPFDLEDSEDWEDWAPENSDLEDLEDWEDWEDSEDWEDWAQENSDWEQEDSDSKEETYKVDSEDSEKETSKVDSEDEDEEEETYKERIDYDQKTTGLTEAVQTGIGTLNGIRVAIGVMDFAVMGGSMGSVVGEKITRLIESATNQRLPLILVSSSGGARMQEGSLSLMQMAKISSALYDYQSRKRLFYISILASPTTGGVTASFGMLGDIVIGEPFAYIAFAGARVIEETLKIEVPEDSQVAELLFDKGLLDAIVPRNILKDVLSELFQLHAFFPLN
uniref:Acetyl-coenzyme A carboxylase carboxyl transferase subunit beta, chloroplastic n=1 Tax=Litwinowia tenuissima TaxID=537172 RepID=A0A6M8Z1K5_9BRAS|nr:carboxytransferase beta subunit [Litwinowia tenuissima]QKK45049.1 carboxytransferase beta subunit [Litwinowia tenuissima]